MDSKKSQELNHTSEQQKYNVTPVEAPPSYNEAMGNTPYRPTAPQLETESTNPSANNDYAQNQYSQQGPPPVYTTNDPRFAQWDDNATRILITNRLRMNDQFNRAKSKQEEDLLWNLILIELINDGYTNLMLYNLIEYWQFQYYIYQSLLNGLTGSSSSNSWQYFEPMHSVFGGGGSSGFSSSDVFSSNSSYFPSSSVNSGPSILPSSNTNYSTTFLPTPMIGPTPIIHQTPMMNSSPATNQTVETSSTLPNQDTNVTSSIPNTQVSSVPDATPSVQPLPSTADTNAISESVPLLEQSNAANNMNLETSNLLPTSTNDIQLSNMPNSTLDAVSASAVTPNLGVYPSADIIPSADTTTNVLSEIDSSTGNNILSSDVITSQPTESLVPTLLNDNDVITSQPTFSSPPLTTGDTNEHDGCCGGDDGCCGGGGDDDGCCGDDDCCGDGDCCTGCDDCGDGCGDCDGCDFG